MKKFCWQEGFSLIELLVVVSISLLTIGGGVAAYLDFNQRQDVIEVGRNLESALEAARIKARAGEKPSGCPTLIGYQVFVDSIANTAQLRAICQGGAVVTITDYELSKAVTISNDMTVNFRTLHGGSGGGAVYVGAGGKYYTVEVGPGGNIKGGLTSDVGGFETNSGNPSYGI